MGLRGPKPKGEEPWYREVAELMVNEFMNFSVACQALGHKFNTAQEEHVHEFSPAFRNLLAGMHIEYFVELGSSPEIGRDYVKGVAVAAIRNLAESEQWEKVAIPLKQLSDVLGLTKETEDRPVFANLTQKQIDELRREAEAEEKLEREQRTQDAKKIVVVVDSNSEPN